MGKNWMINWKVLILLVLSGVSLGCVNQSINNSPCATLSAPIQFNPSASLSLMLGSDAIKAAIDAVTSQFPLQGNKPTSELTKLGTDAAIKTAKANGKNPTEGDIKALDTYLREEVIPTVRQNPTCNFVTVMTSSARPYVVVEKLFLRNEGGKTFPMIGIVNTGEAEAKTHIVISLILDGRAHPTLSDIPLLPRERRTISFPDSTLPIPDIQSGKVILGIAIDISYPLESGATPAMHRQAWQYDHTSKEFYFLPPR